MQDSYVIPPRLFGNHARRKGSAVANIPPAGVKWMWELHTQRAGGIIGDEMGADQARMFMPSHARNSRHRQHRSNAIV